VCGVCVWVCVWGGGGVRDCLARHVFQNERTQKTESAARGGGKWPREEVLTHGLLLVGDAPNIECEY
jgi:hypothetical protein